MVLDSTQPGRDLGVDPRDVAGEREGFEPVEHLLDEGRPVDGASAPALTGGLPASSSLTVIALIATDARLEDRIEVLARTLALELDHRLVSISSPIALFNPTSGVAPVGQSVLASSLIRLRSSSNSGSDEGGRRSIARKSAPRKPSPPYGAECAAIGRPLPVISDRFTVGDPVEDVGEVARQAPWLSSP